MRKYRPKERPLSKIPLLRLRTASIEPPELIRNPGREI